jgi:hypothetical protein
MNQLINSLDEQRLPDGDLYFTGVDMRVDPQQLKPGFCSFAKNARFRFGRAEARLGMMPVRFNFLGATSWGVNWDEGDINWNIPVSIGTIYGVGVWEDPNGAQWQLFAASRTGEAIKIWAGRQGNRVRQVPVSVTIAVPSDSNFPSNSQTALDGFWFTSAFNKCFLHRGYDDTVLTMDSLDTGFTVATSTDSTNPSIFSIPNSKTSIYFQNRLSVPYIPTGASKADNVAVSDILSATDYSVFNSFRINQGDADDVVHLEKFNDNTIVVFKDSSIYAVTNLQGDWSANAILDDITTEYGLVGRRSVVNVGKDLWFLSQRGVTSINRTEENKLQGTDQPNSAPMQPMVDRINWFAAKNNASAGYFRDRYYLSIPIDGSYTNNCVLVYDFLNKAWSGYDDTTVKYFFTADNNGSDALYFVDYSGCIGLYEYSEEDAIKAGATGTYSVDIVLSGHPSDGSTLSVTNGDTIRATREVEWSEHPSGDDVTLSDGTTAVLSLAENWDQGATKHWGVGSDYSDPCNTFPAQNLYLGFSTGNANYDQWDSGGATASQLACGVRLTSSSPIGVTTNDPYITLINSAETSVTCQPIEFEVITRAYGYAGGNQGRWRTGMLHVSTWDPKYTVTVITDGAYEESAWVDQNGAIAYITKDRTKYLGFAIEDWAVANPNKDFRTPGREDYSVTLDTDEVNGGTCLDDGGIELAKYQTWANKYLTNRRGSYYQVKITNIQGRIRIHAAGAEKMNGEQKHGEHGALH